MNLKLKVWRQKNAQDKGKIVDYDAKNISPDMSFLEMLDIVNEELILKGQEPIVFDHDCREGICGMCSQTINGIPHGPERGTTVCQLHMRHFKDGDTIFIEPWRARAFPVMKDLIVDRSALDKNHSGGRICLGRYRRMPGRQFAARLPRTTPKTRWTLPPVSVAAPVWRPARMPRRCCSFPPRSAISRNCRKARSNGSSAFRQWLRPWTTPGFGNCTNYYECEAVCPKEISVRFIALMNREYLRSINHVSKKKAAGGF